MQRAGQQAMEAWEVTLTQATMVTQSSTSALRLMANLEIHLRATKTVARLTKTALVMSTRFDRSTRSMLGHGCHGWWAGEEVEAVDSGCDECC